MPSLADLIVQSLDEMITLVEAVDTQDITMEVLTPLPTEVIEVWVPGLPGPPGLTIERIDAGINGNLQIGVGRHKFYLGGGGTYVLDSVAVSIGTAPTGQPAIIDINFNGISIYTTQANRPTIAIGANLATIAAHQVVTFASGGYFGFDVDQIGSTFPGADLVATLRLRQVAL